MRRVEAVLALLVAVSLSAGAAAQEPAPAADDSYARCCPSPRAARIGSRVFRPSGSGNAPSAARWALPGGPISRRWPRVSPCNWRIWGGREPARSGPAGVVAPARSSRYRRSRRGGLDSAAADGAGAWRRCASWRRGAARTLWPGSRSRGVSAARGRHRDCGRRGGLAGGRATCISRPRTSSCRWSTSRLRRIAATNAPRTSGVGGGGMAPAILAAHRQAAPERPARPKVGAAVCAEAGIGVAAVQRRPEPTTGWR